MRGRFDWSLLLIVSACHSGEPLSLLVELPNTAGKMGFVTGSPGCATQGECSSGVCQPDVGGTPRCCEADCLASGRVCSTAGECVCTSQRREIAGSCLLEDGEPCRGLAECASQQCADGVCCNDACDGVCERCDAPSQAGTCALHDEDPSCVDNTGFECRARKRCRLPLASVCGTAADCDSEHCEPARSDAPICCEAPCSGVCQRCGTNGACDAYPTTDPGCPPVTCPSKTPCREYHTPASGECSGNGQCAQCEPLNTRAAVACGVGAQCDGLGECRVTGLGRVAAGSTHTCAIRDDGNVLRCWGNNEFGQLGALFDQPGVGVDEVPANVRGLELDFGRKVVQITAGFAHTCVLFDDGNVRCWGRLVEHAIFGTVTGLLGTNDVARDAAGFVQPLTTGDVRLSAPAVQISAAVGGAHTCAVLTSGKVSCWGWNADGQCGYGYVGPSVGDESNEDLPVVDLDAPALAVAVGAAHTCALLEGGLVSCWGMGDHGRLGYGDVTDRFEPPGAVPIGEPVLQVSAGLGHTCVLLEGGRVRCWGDNGDGQLGYGHDQTIGDDETPEQAASSGPSGSAALGGDVPVGGLNVIQISAMAGARAQCALFASGAVRCWGSNDQGELGYGHNQTLGTRFTPDQLARRTVSGLEPDAGGDLELGSAALALSVGGRCALLDSGALYCWGANESGQLGLPDYVPSGSAVAEPMEMGPVIWE